MDVPLEDGTLKKRSLTDGDGSKVTDGGTPEPARGRGGARVAEESAGITPVTLISELSRWFEESLCFFLPTRHRHKLLPFSSAVCRYGFDAPHHLRLKGHI